MIETQFLAQIVDDNVRKLVAAPEFHYVSVKSVLEGDMLGTVIRHTLTSSWDDIWSGKLAVLPRSGMTACASFAASGGQKLG